MGQYYSQLTNGERNQLYALRKAKIPMTEIANQLNRSRTALYNELARNTGGRGYRPKQAQEFAEQRRAGKVTPRGRFTSNFPSGREGASKASIRTQGEPPRVYRRLIS